MEMAEEWNRLCLLEDARSIAQDNYGKDPFDADNLTRWGSVLLQLSHYQNGEDTKKMIEDAISKLEEALVFNPIKHDAFWLLGNCFANQALMASDLNEINGYKDKASAYYEKALHEDPGNENYIRSLELFTKAPEMEKDIHTNANMVKDNLNREMDKEIHTNAKMDKDVLTNGDMDKEIHTDAEVDKDIHTHAETEEDIHTNAYDQQFIGDASSKAEAPEMETDIHTNANMDKDTLTNWETDEEIHTNAKMDKGILTNGDMDKEIHTRAEIDKDIHTHAETEEGIHTNAFDQQFIGDASSKAEISKKRSLKKYAIFGWIILAVGIVAWAGTAISCDPPPLPR